MTDYIRNADSEHMRHLTAGLSCPFCALARVTVERDALHDALAKATHECGQTFADPDGDRLCVRCGVEEHMPRHDTPAVVLARVAAEGGTE